MVTLAKTGNSEIDEQHAVMQHCLSDLASLLEGPCEPAALIGSLEALTSYAEWHFTFEERLLKRGAYPHLPEHVAEHRAILKQLSSLRRHLGSGKREAVSLLSIVGQWIVDHVNHEDLRSAGYLGSNESDGVLNERTKPALSLRH